MSYSPKKMCAKASCVAYFIDDKWGAIRAHGVGWFLQRNGTVWCPDHIPDWHAKWIASRSKND